MELWSTGGRFSGELVYLGLGRKISIYVIDEKLLLVTEITLSTVLLFFVLVECLKAFNNFVILCYTHGKLECQIPIFISKLNFFELQVFLFFSSFSCHKIFREFTRKVKTTVDCSIFSIFFLNLGPCPFPRSLRVRKSDLKYKFF